jgi:translocation and assembly module TamB
MQLANNVIRVETGRLRGPETDLSVSGQISLAQATPLDLKISGTLNTALARAWEPDLTASGALVMNATLRGTFDKPDFSGRAELQNGEFRYAGFSNGLTNVKGMVLFSGSQATIQSLTGESGGGTVQVTGFASIHEGLIAFRVETHARSVRIRYPEGVSSVSDADLTFAGTEDRSEASGKVTLRRITINPKSDAATILATASTPIHTVAANKGFAANVNLDIQVETAVDVVFETSVAQGVQADANLRLRGTVTSPALLGRINVTHGDIVFFGNKYTISQGTLTFSDPARIAPILNIDLTTKARGVDVTLTVSGAINKLNVSYRSDPPLQFADIVALLATGRSPTTATLAANTGQSQNFQQLNGNALLGQALANPAADRLQRFFGVSRLKIDPQLTGVTGSPEARLTIEQEVTPQLLFTYVSDVSNTSTQLIRVEWSFSKSWGAILTREENGYVSLDFAYKKRFK